MWTKILLSLAFVTAATVLGVAWFTRIPTSGTGAQTPAAQTQPQEQQPQAQTPAASGYTMAQVAAHNSSQSCWAAINGNVYDLTTWIPRHPGGAAAILSLCGTDGSAAFNAQHDSQRRPEQELAQLLIGNLAP